jgi:predicted nucleic acid-binding protein
MADKVVDASALAAVAFDEADAERVMAEIGGHRLHAPALLAFEVMNTAWKKAQRHRARAQAFLDALDLLWHLDLKYRDVDHRAIVMLGLETNLTAYDASYVWLARSLQMPLVSLDRRQMAIFERR